MKIDISTNVHLDDIRYALQMGLTTKQLVNFVMSIGDNLSDPYEFYDLLIHKLNKLDRESNENS